MMLRDVPVEYARCRAWNHVWDFTTVERGAGVWVQGLRCMNCGTERAVKVNVQTGSRKGRYTYPEDHNKEAVPYKMPHGSGGVLTAEERAAITLDEIASRYQGNGSKKRKKARAPR